MESTIATISQFGTRQTRAGEVFTLTADGVEYSTFKRDIWSLAAPFAMQRAKILFSVTEKGDRVYRNLEGVESANGLEAPTWTNDLPQAQGASPMPSPPMNLTPDYARPKHPDDQRDIRKAVALDKAVMMAAHFDPPAKGPAEIITVAEYFLDWLQQ